MKMAAPSWLPKPKTEKDGTQRSSGFARRRHHCRMQKLLDSEKSKAAGGRSAAYSYCRQDGGLSALQRLGFGEGTRPLRFVKRPGTTAVPRDFRKRL